MSTYVMYALCIVAVVALVIISMLGNGNGSSEALRQRIENRRQANGGTAAAPVASMRGAASERSATDTAGPMAA